MTQDSDTTRWTVIAYVGPQVTSKGARCVHLYPDIPGGARYHCATVYEEKFPLLPYELGDVLMEAEIITGNAPSPEQAKASGLWQPCAPFHVLTKNNSDGSKTKNIAHILGPVTAGTPEHSVPASRSLEQSVQGLEWNPVPLEDVEEQFTYILAETMKKLDTLMAFTDIKNVVMGGEDDADEEIAEAGLGWGYSLEWNKFIFSLAWRDANDQYRVVRPALLAPAITQVEKIPDPDAILDGERADFLSDVAEQHSGIIDAEMAKLLCKTLEIKGSAEEGKLRVQQAKRIWLFADLCAPPFAMKKNDASKIAWQAYPDAIPF